MDDQVDVLADGSSHRRPVTEVTVSRGLLVEVLGDGFVGEVIRVAGGRLHLKDRRGRERSFALADQGFMVDDRPVRLVLPQRPRPAPIATRTTASGSIAVEQAQARVAQPSRILVEGVHDAEIIERVWGDDLRVEGLVVETLDGIDDLEDVVRAFAPTRARRLGVLVDHLLPGTKEHRIAARIRDPHVLVTGHPYVDVWAAVKPAAVGIDSWPEVPMDVPWKEGVAAALGEADPQALWRRVLGSVRSYTDLDRSLVGAVEQLIDFLTEPA